MKIADLLSDMQISQQVLSVLTGIPRNRIAKWSVANIEPPKATDQALIEYFLENYKGYTPEELKQAAEEIEKKGTGSVIVLGKKVPMRLSEDDFHSAFPDWKGVPVYNTEVSASFITKYKDDSDGKWEPLYYLRDPQFRDCNFAARIAGDSMHSEIRHGDYIVCQEIVDKSIIVYGEIYYVITSNGLETCKYVNALPIYSDDPKDTRKMYDYERVLLVPKNDSISPTPLHKKDILKLYKVKGIVRGY